MVTSVWLVLTSLVLLVIVFGVAREMAFRYWDSGAAGRTSRPDSYPTPVDFATRPTETIDGG